VGRLTVIQSDVLEANSRNRIVIPTGAQRSGGTCCFSSTSLADASAQMNHERL
jgi:hypothetical protein